MCYEQLKGTQAQVHPRTQSFAREKDHCKDALPEFRVEEAFGMISGVEGRKRVGKVC